ncbi:MAG: glycosyltransferase family 4 protein [Neomegalonema sp.]|nr:glycosyltransferase family 4 protein [Neomegalonema sp.]
MTTIIVPFVNAKLGGSHFSSLNLCAELSKSDEFNPIVLCPPNTPLADEVASRGLKHEPLHVAPRTDSTWASSLVGWPARARRLRQTAAPKGAVVYCQSPAALTYWGLAARAGGYGLVYHHRSFLKMKWRNRMLMRLPHAFLAVSNACVDNMKALGVAEAYWLRNPFIIDDTPGLIAQQRQEARDELGIDAGTPVVGFVANLMQRKRPKFFVDMAAELTKTRPDVIFAIFGSEWDTSGEELLARAKEKGVADKVRYAGFVSPAQKAMACLDVLAIPALREPYGRTVVEAAMMGMPMVVSESGGNTEAYKDVGGDLLAPENATPAEFAALVAQLLDGRLGPAPDSANAQRVRGNYAPENQARAMGPIFEAVAQRKPIPAPY